MSNLAEFKQQGFNEALEKLKKMEEKGTDIKPVFREFLKGFKDYISNNWRSDTGPFGNQHKTLKWKKYKAFKLSIGKQGWADLILTGRMKRAATGDKSAGWNETITNREMKWGIDDSKVPYAWKHQLGFNRIPQRPFFALKDGSLPGPLYQLFKNITLRKINEAANK